MNTPTFRSKALSDVLGRQPKHVEPPSNRISDYFGTNVFNEGAMRMFLTEDAYRAVRSAIDRGERIDRRLADQWPVA